MDTERKPTRRGSRLPFALAGAAALTAVGFGPGAVQQTEASWVAESQVGGSYSTASVEPVSDVECAGQSPSDGVLSDVTSVLNLPEGITLFDLTEGVEVTWSNPEGDQTHYHVLVNGQEYGDPIDVQDENSVTIEGLQSDYALGSNTVEIDVRSSFHGHWLTSSVPELEISLITVDVRLGQAELFACEPVNVDDVDAPENDETPSPPPTSDEGTSATENSPSPETSMPAETSEAGQPAGEPESDVVENEPETGASPTGDPHPPPPPPLPTISRPLMGEDPSSPTEGGSDADASESASAQETGTPSSNPAD